MAFLLHLKDDWGIHVFLFVLSSTRAKVLNSPTLNFTFPHTSKCFLSNGIRNMHILASCLELQALRFGYVILSKNVILEVFNLSKKDKKN
jgi:hypothetical protein